MVRHQVGIHIAIYLLLSAGCTHHQLRRSATNHSQSFSDVQTRQILNNLARFAHNPQSMPYFALPTGGTAEVTDDLSSSGPDLSLTRFTLGSWSLGTGASRSNKQTFTLDPVTDTRKLELMRCAFQRVMHGTCGCIESGTCPDCEKVFNKFYLGEESPGKTPRLSVDGRPMFLALASTDELKSASPKGTVLVGYRNELNQAIYVRETDRQPVDVAELEESDLLKPLYDTNSLDLHTERTGRVTVNCLTSGWVRVGDRDDFKKCDPCCLVGEHCGTYVMIPSCFRDELTKLSLVILDIATHETAVSDSGKKETASTANKTSGFYGMIGNLLPSESTYSAEPSSLAPNDLLDEVESLIRTPEQPRTYSSPGANLLLNDQYLRALTPNR